MTTPPPLLLAPLLALALALAATASAAPTPPTPPPAPASRPAACRATGDVLLAIHHMRVGKPSSDLALYASGAWTFAETDEHGKRVRAADGCLAADVLANAKRELAAMPWKLAPSELACDAIAAESTRFTPAGKVAFADEACSSQALDPTSRAAVADVAKILDAAVPPARPAPPCCKTS